MVNMNDNASSSGNGKTTLIKLYTTVIQIMNQIIQHPDKNDFRKLRIDHPALWVRLFSVCVSVSLFVGSILCNFVCLSFYLNVCAFVYISTIDKPCSIIAPFSA